MINKNEMKIEYEDIKILCKQYEDIKSYETAYLIKWQFIENTVKKIAENKRREKLIIELDSWLDFFKGNLNEKPNNKIKLNLAIQSINLPNEKLLKECFKTKMPNLLTTLNSKGKFRIKRNKIAHKFELFGKNETYEDYIKQLDETIIELLNYEY